MAMVVVRCCRNGAGFLLLFHDAMVGCGQSWLWGSKFSFWDGVRMLCALMFFPSFYSLSLGNPFYQLPLLQINGSSGVVLRYCMMARWCLWHDRQPVTHSRINWLTRSSKLGRISATQCVVGISSEGTKVIRCASIICTLNSLADMTFRPSPFESTTRQLPYLICSLSLHLGLTRFCRAIKSLLFIL